MKFTFIKLYRSEFPVVKMCQVLAVSQSGYYCWNKRKRSNRDLKRDALKEKISDLFHNKHGQMAGSPTITHDLQDEPEYSKISRSYVASLMHDMGLRCKIQKKFTVTTDSSHKKHVAKNLLNRKFIQKRPNTVIVGDITYIRVASYWMYLSVFIDLYSRRVVGWDLSRSLSADSSCRALRKYLTVAGNIKDLMVHTDQGVQYVSDIFRKILQSIGAVQSMSRRGNCWDNAVAESFFHTLKTRLIFHRKYQTKKELVRDLFWYIEIYYNRVRKHSANNWMTPEQKEIKFYENKKVA